MPINSFADYPLSWRPTRETLKPGPVYLALAAALADDIAGGALPPGTKLPPQRELADYLDLDFTTVTRAYGVCRERGLVYGVTGRGTFVAAPDSDPTANPRPTARRSTAPSSKASRPPAPTRPSPPRGQFLRGTPPRTSSPIATATVRRALARRASPG